MMRFQKIMSDEGRQLDLILGSPSISRYAAGLEHTQVGGVHVDLWASVDICGVHASYSTNFRTGNLYRVLTPVP